MSVRSRAPYCQYWPAAHVGDLVAVVFVAELWTNFLNWPRDAAALDGGDDDGGGCGWGHRRPLVGQVTHYYWKMVVVVVVALVLVEQKLNPRVFELDLKKQLASHKY